MTPTLAARVVHVAVGLCVVSSLVRHVSVMASETLVRTGTRGKLVVLKAAMRGGKRSGRSLVSMVLTSQAHRRRTPKKNRRIPTIPTGCFDAGIVYVSAVDTGPRRSDSGVLGGTAQRLRHRSFPAPPPARCLRRVPEVMVRRRLRPELARVGLLGGRDLLTTGCAYCTKAPPTRSTPNPRPVAPHRRAVQPDDAGSLHSHRVSPSPTGRSSSSPLRRTHPTDVLRCQDIRNSQKS